MNITLYEYMDMKGCTRRTLITWLLAHRCRIMYPAFDAVVLIRKQQKCSSAFRKEMYARKLVKKYSIEVSSKAIIGEGFRLSHVSGIVIGEGVIIGENVRIYQGVTIGEKDGCYPHILNEVVVYPGAKILGGITIGNHAVIGANAVVLSDIPDYGVAVGVPAKVVRV